MAISVVAILGAAVGAAVVIAGAWLLREPSAGARRASLSVPTRMALGLTLLVLGYHVAAWSLPDSWTPMKVPLERWWMLAAGAGAMIGSSVAMDRREEEAKRQRDEETK